jgi:hypothetical protein
MRQFTALLVTRNRGGRELEGEAAALTRSRSRIVDDDP